MKRIALAALAVVVLFLAGMGAGDIFIGSRAMIVNAAGDDRVSIGIDGMGTGFVVVRDYTGKEVWGFFNGKPIGAPAGAPGAAASPVAAQPPSAPSASSGANVGQLVSVRTMLPLPIPEEAYGFRNECENLEAAAEDLDAKAADFLAKTYPHYHHHHAYDHHDSRCRDAVTQARQRDRNSANLLKADATKKRTKAKQLRGKALKLEREAKIVRQSIRVWNGSNYSILETTRDISAALSKIAPGAFVSWTGRRRELSMEGNELFIVASVKVVQRPANWNDAP